MGVFHDCDVTLWPGFWTDTDLLLVSHATTSYVTFSPDAIRLSKTSHLSLCARLTYELLPQRRSVSSYSCMSTYSGSLRRPLRFKPEVDVEASDVSLPVVSGAGMTTSSSESRDDVTDDALVTSS